MKNNISDAVEILKNARHVTGFSGAGISVESGIPPFRGENGLWNRYDTKYLEIDFFLSHPGESWQKIKEIFYEFFGKTQPNDAHRALARMEEHGMVRGVITQNIDNLHQEAGSRTVYEFHGNYQKLVCLSCFKSYKAREIDLNVLPPRCERCQGVLKPDFILFGEAIPEPARTLSFDEAEKADVFLIIGSTGEVMPAASIPPLARQNGAAIVEVNVEPSNYTASISDVFLQGKATEIMQKLLRELNIAM